MLHDDDKSTGSIKFMERRTHKRFTTLCQIKNNGIFCMKLIHNNKSYCVHSINAKFKYMLWHHRIVYRSRFQKTTKLVNGAPAVCDSPNKYCWICTSANVPRAPTTHDSIANPTMPFQQLHMNFGFSVQKSKNKNRHDSLKGIDDEPCYLVIKDTFAGCKHGEKFANKTPPTQWLRFCFEQHAPDETSTNNMKIRVDTGGKLGMSHEFRPVCHLFGHVIHDVAPNSSSENGAVEVANRDIR